ncbi:hypothetical protein SRHO_G00176240 [Serrasalmus rhombeus]
MSQRCTVQSAVFSSPSLCFSSFVWPQIGMYESQQPNQLNSLNLSALFSTTTALEIKKGARLVQELQPETQTAQRT